MPGMGRFTAFFDAVVAPAPPTAVRRPTSATMVRGFRIHLLESTNAFGGRYFMLWVNL